MKKKSFIKFMLLAVIMLVVGNEMAWADNIVPKLFLSAKNTPSGHTNWTITNAAINNANTDYWKMLSGSSLVTPEMDFSSFSDIQIILSLQSFGTIESHSDDIKIEHWNGTAWSQVGSNLHTESKSKANQTVSLPYSNATAKIRITAPNSTSSAGARVYSVEITGTPAASCTPLGTPTVTPTAGNTEATLSWGAVANASSYTLIWNGGSPETVTSPVTKTGLTNGVTYSYSVMAVGDGTTYCATNTAATGNVTPVAPLYTITPSSSNNSHGTVSLTGSVITATPASGYTYATPAYTVLSGTATVSQSGNAFTVSPTSDCAVRINFEAKPTYTLSLNNVGEAYTDSNFPFITYQGNTITLPTLDNCGSYTFVGWDTNSSTTSAPTFAAGATYNTTAGNVTLYAVYSQTTGGGTVTSNLSASIVSTLETMAYATTYTKVIDGKTWTFTGCYRQNASADNLQMNSTDTRYIQTPDMGSEITSVKINVKRNAAGNIGIYTTTGTLIKSIAVTTSANDYIETISGYNQVQIYNSETGVTNFYSVEVTADASTTTYTTAPNCNAAQITISETELTGFGYVENDGPSAEQSFTVSGVNLTNDISIAATTNYEISKTSGSGYATPLTFTPAEVATAQTVYVRLKSGLSQGAYNNEVINVTSTGADAKTVTVSGSVTEQINAEPSAHATGFAAVEDGQNAITLSWTDASGADGYLIKASAVSYAAIAAPVDGTPESDAALVKNVAQGTEIVEFTGLAASTTYYFKIWPYSNSAANIDYKTDGSVPQISTATATPLGIPVATAATAITPTGFTANWGAVASATGYELDVYTKTIGANVTETESFDGVIPGSEGKVISSATYLTGWSVSSQSTSRQIYTTTNNFGKLTPSFAFTITGDYIQTTTYSSPIKSFSFWAKDQKGSVTSTSTTLIEGFNGTAWSTIATLSNADVVTAGTKTYDLISLGKTDVVKIKMTFTKTDGNLSIDDIAVTYAGVTNTPIAGSPFTVTETTKTVTGLTANSAYYYAVVAKNGGATSASSNVITAFTAIDGDVSASAMPDCPTCDVTVATGGTLTLNVSKTYNSVTVAPGAKLTLQNGFSLSAPITLQSNASGTATFVDARTHANKTNITATVQQHLPAASTRTWWYLASPVSGAASTVFGSNKIGDYSETTRSYSNPFTEATTLTAGKGYVVKMTAASAANYVFENKTLNTGNISVPLTRTVTETPDNAKRGFNLVGNPYPSYLNWDLAYNNSTNVRSTIWYRTLNGASMEFHTYNAAIGASVPSSANGYIPPMQAFWVKVDKDPTVGSVSNGILNFTNDMRSHDLSALGNPLKAPAADRNLVRLSISNGTLSDETVIVTHPSASDNYDSYDSEKMANGDTNRPEIFSMAGNQELVINGISPLTDSKQIALGVRPGRAGNYTISLTEWRNTGNMEAVLRDNQLGEELILTESNNYSFDTDGSTSTSRFSLLFRAKGSNTGFDRISSDLMIYSTQNTIRVESASLEGNNISIFNALGQPVFNGKAQSNRLEINGLTPAVYMVKVSNQTKMVIVK